MRYSAYPNDWEISSLVSPAGWGYSGKDANNAGGGEPTGLTVSNNFEDALAECDAVFFAKYDHPYLAKDKFVFPQMENAIACKKNIFCALDLTKKEHDWIKEKCDKEHIIFYYYGDNFENEAPDSIEFDFEDYSFAKINAPVVYICGMMDSVGKFDTQLDLHSYLKKLGYKATLISSHSYGKLFKSYSVPSFLYSKNIAEIEKIKLFNNYVKEIELRDEPDIIIIAVPGGIIPLDVEYTNDFGITAFEMTRAVIPDAALVCTYFDPMLENNFPQIDLICTHRFSMDVTAWLMSDIDLHKVGINFGKFPTDPILVDQYLEEKSFPKPVLSSRNRHKAFEILLDTLSQYAEVEAY